MIWKKQLRTTLFLLVFIIGCILSGLYFRGQSEPTVTISTEGEPVIQEINDALSRLENRATEDLATLRQVADDGIPEKAELVFEGLTDENTTRSLIAALQNADLNAEFYLTGADATANASSLSMVADAGFVIGTAYSAAALRVEPFAAKQAVSEFVRTGAAVQTVVGIWPSQLLSPETPTEDLLAAAYACSISTVVVPTQTIELEALGDDTQVQQLINAMPRGSILCVQLTKGVQNAADKLESLCVALAKTDLDSSAQTLMAQNPTSVEPIQRVYTSERAVAFSFAGFGNHVELSGVLSALSALHATATFYATQEELIRYPDDIQKVIDQGHSLGIAIQVGLYPSASAMLAELLITQEAIRTNFAYAGTLSVRPALGSSNEALKLACGAGGYTLLSAMLNAVRNEDIRATDAATVLDEILPENAGVLQRGEIVHFQMQQYQKSDTMLGDLVRLMATNRNVYTIKPIADILANTEDLYEYPLPADQILPEVKDKIYPGQLTGNPITAIATRYIGIDWVATSSFLPGFTSEELKRLDKTGLIPNNKNMVFLTFDDWGSDRAITALLDVLKAHNAHATFFVRTQNVVYNPNLLRAIAVDGHTIGDHTHTHFPLSNDTGNGKKFTELTETQVIELKQDMVTSYQLLQSIIGDMKVNNRPSLSLLFRPPTLAVGKNGLAAVLDCGFSYVVSGKYTTQDYKAVSATKLAADLKKYTESGAVLIMHMSDTSIYTAEALDIYLSEMERKYVDKPYQFVGLSEVLK